MLLLIPGGGAAGDIFAPVVGPLAQHSTAVRYDPRGISRSRIDGPAEHVPIDAHADDAWRLLQAVGDEPAFVLRSSGGAMIGLALAERHPEAVRTLVVHEPPVFGFLPTDDPRRDGNQTIYDTYLKEGPGPANGQFMAITSLGALASGETPLRCRMPWRR